VFREDAARPGSACYAPSGSVPFLFQKWSAAYMNGRDANLDKSCVASGGVKIVNTETGTQKTVNGYPILKELNRRSGAV